MGHANLIRAATDADLPAIRELHLTSWQRTYAGLVPDRFLYDEAPDYLARKWASLPAGTTLIAEREGALIGLAYVDEADPAYLDALHVRADVIGQGYGTRLLTQAFSSVAARAVSRAYLYVVEGNERALRFYQRFGAYETWRGPDPDHAADSTAIRLEWDDISTMLKVES